MKSKFLLAMGIIYIIFGVFMLISAVGGEGTDILSIIDMIVFLVGGIMAVMYCGDPEKARYCKIVGIISLIIAIIYAVSFALVGSLGVAVVGYLQAEAGAILGGMMAAIIVLNLLFPILYVVAAFKFVKKAQ